jgi:heat shock protein HslJ
MSAVRALALTGGVVALVGTVAVATALVGDGGDGTANGSVPVGGLAELSGSWLAVNDTTAPAPLRATVRLTFGDGRVVAETGCNTARGPVAVEESVLVADALATTRMACEPPLLAQEQWVVDMLTSRPRLELSGPYLALHWGADERWWLGLEKEGAGAEPTATP